MQQRIEEAIEVNLRKGHCYALLFTESLNDPKHGQAVLWNEICLASFSRDVLNGLFGDLDTIQCDIFPYHMAWLYK